MYINFWYPVCTATELEDTPLRVELLGLRFVAYRDSHGVAHILSDTCIHRGGSLGNGTVQGDNVRCPYHGWEFDSSGKCAHIPSLADKRPPGRAKVDAYPVQEKYGIVFAFLGDEPETTRVPLYEIPEIGKDGWRASEPSARDIKCYYERSVENGLDPWHNEFVHPSQGLPVPNPDTVVIEDIPHGTRFMVSYGEQQDKPEYEKALSSNPDELCAGSLYYGPNTLITDIRFTATTSFIQYAFEAPLNEHVTRVYLVNLRNCMLEPGMDKRVAEINSKVADEDVVILEDLWPVRTPDTNTKELLTEGDAMVVRYREHLKEWDEKGWRIDMKALRASEGDVAYAIPCPGRSSSGNWILAPVPLV